MFAHERLVRHTSTVMDPSNFFHTRVKFVDTADFTNEKNRTFDLPVEINNITSQLES